MTGMPPLRMVVYGKGGIGKSTIAANLSTIFARQGLGVLHVGCDPKHDSTYALLPGKPPPTIIDRFLANKTVPSVEEIVSRGRHGVACLEAGGPAPGEGCGGRGVMLASEVLKQLNLCSAGLYQVVLFDLVGDIVCGGFTAPLQLGLGRLVVIVASDNVMSLYAANNISRVVVRYAGSGTRLAGMIFNNLKRGSDRAVLEEFASLLNTRVLDFLPFTPQLRQAERKRVPLVELSPTCSFSRRLNRLAQHLLQTSEEDLPTPTPLRDEEFDAFVRRLPGGA